jgi:hypothetical protein
VDSPLAASDSGSVESNDVLVQLIQRCKCADAARVNVRDVQQAGYNECVCYSYGAGCVFGRKADSGGERSLRLCDEGGTASDRVEWRVRKGNVLRLWAGGGLPRDIIRCHERRECERRHKKPATRSVRKHALQDLQLGIRWARPRPLKHRLLNV